MDDLSGLDWSSSSAANKQNAGKPTLAAQSAAFGTSSAPFSSYPSLRPTPPPGVGSGRNTPLSTLSAQGSGASAGVAARQQPPAATKPGQDSFSNLINFGANKNPANLSLREQQERLNAEKRRKEEERRKQTQANYGDGQFFDALGRGGGSAAGAGSAGTSRTGSPALAPPPSSISRGASPLNGGGGSGGGSGDDDLFAAFDADTKVDNASHFPPPASNNSGKSTPANGALDLNDPSAWGKPPTASNGAGGRDGGGQGAGGATTTIDDDDPFGLNQLQAKTPASAAAPPPPVATGDGDDDDFLGDLAKPVEEVRRKTEAQRQQEAQQQRRQKQPEPGKPIEGSDSDSSSDSDTGAGGGAGAFTKTGNPKFDNAVERLVDYGFSPEDAQRGLTESGHGFDVQAAVNWLLDDAHRQAKEKSRAKQGGGGRGGADQLRVSEEGARASSRNRGTGGPAWMRDAELDGFPSRGDSRSPAAGSSDGDFTKTAAAMGTNFLKTANSLWKTGQKQLQKAVQDFQQDADPSQPKWMRSVEQDHTDAPEEGEPRRRRAAAAVVVAAASAPSATDEAMMLESGARPERRQRDGRSPAAALQATDPRFRTDSQTSSRTQSPTGGFGSGTPGRNSPVPRWQQGAGAADPRVRLTKQAIEEESAQVYVSPARRRRAAAAAPASSAADTASKPSVDAPPEGDLLSNSTALPQRPAPSSAQRSQRAAGAGAGAVRPSPRATPSPRPPRVARQVPPVNSFVLKASAKHRTDGAAHFKRGDYAAAHASYAASLADIPQAHPLLAVLFCNRALTALKTGEPRLAVADADSALAVIGPGNGEGETVGLEDGSGATRDLKDLYGKAMTRKAEALEQMEKWAEAGQVWQQCVEGGVGGATAIAGRQRCQAALKPKPKPATPRPTGPAGVAAGGSFGTGTSTPTSASGRDFEAVQRLREANQAAAREDSEKLGLLDQVDARVAAWRDGKKDNLRALLGSLERVLWENSGWKPVGLHELVMPNKVKVVYMRAIGKTHPDKLPQDASTEVRMIAGTVFSTLNESWDKFKADNKM